MNNKDICVIVTTEATANQFLIGYLKFLQSKGWKVTLICSLTNAPEEFANSTGIDVLDVPMTRNPSPAHDIVSLFRLIRVLKRLRPNVVAVATPKASLLGMIAARVSQVEHRLYLLWGIRFETVSGLPRLMFYLAERVTVRFSTAVHANSKSLARKAIDLGVAREGHIDVVNEGSSHGVDVRKFSPDARVDPADAGTLAFVSEVPPEVCVGFVGRIHPDKGVKTLLDALRILAKHGVPVRALFVGAIEDEATANLIRQSTVPCHLVPPVTDVRPYFRLIDIHCLPSRREGFPNVVLEASAMAVVTVASDATGSVDSVVDGKTGLIFRTDDARSLASSLAQLIERPDLRFELGLNARSRVVSSFAQEYVWAANEAQLCRVVGGGLPQ